MNSIFIADDESKTLGNYIHQNDIDILNIYKTLTSAIGNGIISGLEVLQQINKNMMILIDNNNYSDISYIINNICQYINVHVYVYTENNQEIYEQDIIQEWKHDKLLRTF